MARRNSDTPSALAAELADHQAKYEAGRDSVIQRGTERIDQIARLRAELDIERDLLSDVVGVAVAA